MSGRLVGFRSEKAAQFSALLIQREKGRSEKLKLIKLLYLAERESMAERGRPMFYDEYYSLEHGPICSNALDALNGYADPEIWKLYVTVEDKKNISQSVHRDRAEMGQLSKSDDRILEAIWNRFGWMTAGQIRNWTHINCKEYVEVASGERLPISYETIYKVLGFTEAAQMASHIAEYRSAEAAIAAQ